MEKVASNRRILGPSGKCVLTRMSSCRNPEAIAAPEGVIGPRGVAAYLLVALGPALAMQRYGETEVERTTGALATIAAIGTVFFTLSRMASATALQPQRTSRWGWSRCAGPAIFWGR